MKLGGPISSILSRHPRAGGDRYTSTGRRGRTPADAGVTIAVSILLKQVLAALAALLLAAPALAVLPDEMLANSQLEARARTISQQLRCMVCQNQTIDDSDAPLARDLRLLVRERLVRGDSDQAATAYIVARYGSYVLLQPPLEPATLLLWLGPAAFVLAGGAGVAVYLRRRRTAVTDAPLSPEDSARVDALLRQG